MEKVKEKAGTWFDPSVVEILERRYIDSSAWPRCRRDLRCGRTFQILRVERGSRAGRRV